MTDENDREIDEDIRKEIKQQTDEFVEQIDKNTKEEKSWLIWLEDDLKECSNVAYKIDQLYPDMFAVAGIYYLQQRISDIVDNDSPYAEEDRTDVIDEIISDYLYQAEGMLLQIELLFKNHLVEREDTKDMDRFHYEVGEKITRTINSLDNARETCNETLDELYDSDDEDTDNSR